MTTRRSLLLGGAALAATGVLGGCWYRIYPTYRYRLTVEVETPQGLRTGSTVIAVSASRTAGPLWQGQGGAGMRAKGQAAFVELPNGQTLYALLRGEDGNNWAAGIMFELTPEPAHIQGKDDFDLQMEALYKRRQLIVLPRYRVVERLRETRALYPLLVRFRDERDPATVEQVDPDDLEGSFGAGYRLRRMTVQLTDDPVTRGIRRRLPWLSVSGEKQLSESDIIDKNGPLSQQLFHVDFWM